MSKITLDMSGRGGLAPRFFGDINRTAASPELRYLGNDNQFADGIYNPFRRFGYLSPANGTFETVTNYISTSLTTTLGSSQWWEYIGVALAPASTSAPTVLGTPAFGTVAGTTNSLTISVTVGSGSNRVLTVIACARIKAAVSATYGGVPMTVVARDETTMVYTIFQLAAPAVGTADVVISWDINTDNIAAGCVVTQDTNQTTPSNVYGATTDSSATATLTLTPTVNKCLVLGACYSVAATHTQDSGQTEIFNSLTTAAGFRFSESKKIAFNTSILGCSIYDDINDDHYWGERGALTSQSSGANIMKGDTLDDRSLASALALNTNGNTGATITDLEIYQVNAVRKLFYVYKNSSGNMDVGIAALPFGSNNNTWLTGTVSGAFTNATSTNPFMRKADNGLAYLFQDNVVHKIDGTANGGANGTITPNVLTFPAYFQLIDGLDYRGVMLMGILQRTTDMSAVESGNFSSECGVYLWDRQSTVVKMQDYFPLKGVKEIRKMYVAPNGAARMICVASDRLVQIRELNGTTWDIVEELPPTSYPLFHDSLTVAHTMTYWLGADGYFYGHGSPTNVEKEAIFKLANPTGSCGAILYGGGSTYSSGVTGARTDLEGFYFSLGATSFKKWCINAENSVNGNIQTTVQGDVYTLVKFLPKLSTVNFIRIYGVPCVTNDSNNIATVKIYFNQSTTAWASKIITRTQWTRGYIDIPVDKPYINAVQLEVEFSTSLTIGRDDFAPAYAEIDYTATETNK